MAVSDLESKVEAAFVSVLSGSATLTGLGLTFLRGVESEEQVLPCVVCHCQGGTEEPQNYGNYFQDVSIWIKTKLTKADPSNPTEDRTAAHRALVAPVRDLLSTDDLAAQLSDAVSDFYVFDPVVNGSTQNTVEGDTAKTLKQFKVYCCSADIT
jgi:hypothetical protein